MENLVERLENEAGLTEAQALYAIAVVKNEMEKEGIDIDWKDFLKGKYQEVIEQTKELSDKFSDQADNLSDKITDTVTDVVDNFTNEAKEKAKEFTKKIYDKLND